MHIPVLGSLKDKAVSLFKGMRRTLPRRNNTSDQIDLSLWGLNLSVSRETTLETPSELSVIIPRVEFRHKCTSSPTPSCETEIILSSITVVIAPRHPAEHAPSTSVPATALRININGKADNR